MTLGLTEAANNKIMWLNNCLYFIFSNSPIDINENINCVRSSEGKPFTKIRKKHLRVAILQST